VFGKKGKGTRGNRDSKRRIDLNTALYTKGGGGGGKKEGKRLIPTLSVPQEKNLKKRGGGLRGKLSFCTLPNARGERQLGRSKPHRNLWERKKRGRKGGGPHDSSQCYRDGGGSAWVKRRKREEGRAIAVTYLRRGGRIQVENIIKNLRMDVRRKEK